MALTQSMTQSGVRCNRAVGRYLQTGTAVAFAITCGFKPRVVRVYNITSGDMMEWYEGMADAAAVKTLANGTRSILSSLGITPSDSGFTIGLDTDVNVTSEQIEWIAES